MSSINLPLILTLAVLITGSVWLFDMLILSRSRKAKLAAIEQQFSKITPTTENRIIQDEALEIARREPILVEYSKSFFPVLFIVFFLRSFLVEPFQIPSASMVPNLEIGDFILVNKFTYGIRIPILNDEIIPVNKPKRGEVMVFFPPHEPSTYYIKRVIGIPGDRISYNNNTLSINGEVIPEQLAAMLPAGAPQFRVATEIIGDHKFNTHKNILPTPGHRNSWVVPAGHYFMMGDNRDRSYDSRAWDDPFVPESAIVGKAFIVWMHWEKIYTLPSFDKTRFIK